jgi:ArsR family transcriptional regulator
MRRKPKPTTRSSTNGTSRSEFPPLSEKSILELTQTFRLLADDSRLRILLHLARHGELHVSDLCRRLGQSQPAVSHHLALLRVAGIIEPRRQGKFNYYRISPRFFSDALRQLLAAGGGSVPRKLPFDDFTLSFSGR